VGFDVDAVLRARGGPIRPGASSGMDEEEDAPDDADAP
jgi:hypothetical protein